MELLPIKRAILSVTDKSGLAEFAAALHGLGVELVSTGGTARRLAEAGLPVVEVSRVTGFPEILGGRVKTLHPLIHAGVLADKDDPEHIKTLERIGAKAFDLVCVNLYDFSRAVGQGLGLRQAVEEIDIGGPTLLRAGAKNFHSVLVVPGPGHYPEVLRHLEAGRGAVPLSLRKDLAAETFALVSGYDSMIAGYLAVRNA
ncbi:MAG: IMP cyclohydrolase [Desulfovibrionaceae bacterium]|nr:IMP cyclohydrolase [Desulfovibrionaceae bacterium]